ncbi:serine/threonine-protein kinase [Catenulispora subtropica]|uniref:non-specific serine/threonine protein kinase n=1 Tax=Catenulispora subtropica TaxID=450798 RepID=A0ABP5BSH4_9ACTN
MTGEPGETRAGRTIGGRYRLIGKLGSGGFGRVWSARDEVLGVDVAVKEVWLPPAMEDAERAERLARAEREARNAARLRDHPNIVAIHDVVMDGAPWIVMRLVTGRSLHERLKAEGPLPPAEVARIGGGVLKALAAAHAAGIVHRDVKPANVLLTDEGHVLLGDFGIAVHQADTALTATGAFLGSIEYVAPERARGDDGLAASDLFSLGATLYEAIEGFSPFHRDTPTGSLTAVLFEQPPAPRSAGALEPLLGALLAKEPGARPTAVQALAMAEALESGALVGTAATSSPVGNGPAITSGIGNSSARNGILAGAVAVVLVAGGIAWWASGSGSGKSGTDTTLSQGDAGRTLGRTSGSTGGATGGAPAAGAHSSSTGSAAGVPTEDQLKKALIADGDLSGYTQDKNVLDYSVGMYMYKTQGSCAPMDQLAAKFDGDRDISQPRASATIDIAGQSPGKASSFIGESIEYYGTEEATALMSGFHDLATKCQSPFSAKDAGNDPSYVVKPITAPVLSGVDCVEYDFDGDGKPGYDLTAVARVGGTLVTIKLSAIEAPASSIDPALIAAAVKKAQAAGLPG